MKNSCDDMGELSLMWPLPLLLLFPCFCTWSKHSRDRHEQAAGLR